MIPRLTISAMMMPWLMPNGYLIKKDNFKIANREGVGVVGCWSY